MPRGSLTDIAMVCWLAELAQRRPIWVTWKERDRRTHTTYTPTCSKIGRTKAQKTLYSPVRRLSRTFSQIPGSASSLSSVPEPYRAPCAQTRPLLTEVIGKTVKPLHSQEAPGMQSCNRKSSVSNRSNGPDIKESCGSQTEVSMPHKEPYCFKTQLSSCLGGYWKITIQ